MQLNQAQRLFKAFRATGLCPYVAEQAVRNSEESIRKAAVDEGAEYAAKSLEYRITYPSLLESFVWIKTPQGHDFWRDQRAIQREANYL